MVMPPPPKAVKRKFVLLFQHLVTKRDAQRFGSEVFARRGYDVKLVSCWNALYASCSDQLVVGDFRNTANVISAQSEEELNLFLDTLAGTDLILLTVPLSVETFWLYQALDKRGLRYSCLSLGTIPETFFCRLDGLSNLFKCVRIKFLDAYSFIYRLVERIKLVIAIGPSYLMLKAPLFFIRSGAYNLAFSYPAPFLVRSHIIDVESFDVGWSRLPNKNEVELPRGKYAVFLDEALSHHPDWVIGGGRPENVEKIYEDLRGTFDAIEKETGLPVVISLHPKAGYTESEIEGIFGDRAAFSNITPTLVRGADLVLGHASTSLSYAVIYRKPVLFMTNPQIRASRDGILVDLRASWLEQQPIDMSLINVRIGDPLKIPSVNEKVYENFMHNFICSRTATMGPIWDIVADRFEEISDRE